MSFSSIKSLILSNPNCFNIFNLSSNSFVFTNHNSNSKLLISLILESHVLFKYEIFFMNSLGFSVCKM